MKASIVLFAVFLLLSTTDSQDVSALNVANMQTKWITQKLDNFDPKNTQTWQMRYMVDDSVYKSGNPIFVDIGGDATIFAEQPYYDEISTFVEQYNGLLVYTEQRFYGESRPTPDLSVQYLEKYLNIEQALADLANLIRTLKQTYNGAQNSKVILVGGSYGGLMATWFAELYPDLCDGAWASSAPVGLRANFFEYKEVAGQAVLSVGGQNCYNRIKSAFEYAENMFKQGNGAKLISRLNLCSNFNQSDFMDIANFFSVFSEHITTAIQNGGSYTIQDICELFTNSTDDYENFVTNFILTADYVNGSCLDASYQANFNFRASINWDDNQSGIRQLKFQECHDLGLFQTSDSTAQPFGSTYPLKYFENFCTDLFGAKYTTDYITQRIADYNKKFGGLNPNVTNVFFTQGSLDPWRGAGINTYVIQGATHSEDLFKSTSSDPPELTAAHQKIADLVKGWIGAK